MGFEITAVYEAILLEYCGDCAEVILVKSEFIALRNQRPLRLKKLNNLSAEDTGDAELRNAVGEFLRPSAGFRKLSSTRWWASD